MTLTCITDNRFLFVKTKYSFEDNPFGTHKITLTIHIQLHIDSVWRFLDLKNNDNSFTIIIVYHIRKKTKYEIIFNLLTWKLKYHFIRKFIQIYIKVKHSNKSLERTGGGAEVGAEEVVQTIKSNPHECSKSYINMSTDIISFFYGSS